jgi:hypothetical protein
VKDCVFLSDEILEQTIAFNELDIEEYIGLSGDIKALPINIFKAEKKKGQRRKYWGAT